METWTDDDTVINFLQGIMQAFRTSPLEVIILIGGVAGFIAIVVAFFIFQNRRRQRRQRERSESIFYEKVDRLGLTEIERNALEGMAKELPGGELRKHIVVTDDSAFDAAAYKLIQQKQISEEVAAALRLKLGFRQAAEDEPIYTTAEIPKGKHLYLVDNQNNRSHGVLFDLSPQAMYIKINTEKSDLPQGKKLRIYFRQQSGVYTFTTRVIEVNDDILSCSHSNKVLREQKRQFYRKEVDDQVILQKIETDGASEGERTAARLYDLGGGGAKTENPGKVFSAGDELKLFFALDYEEKVPAKGEVVKTSRDDLYLHVQFKEINETDRDKLIGYIFKQ
jgi:c-di-GMP-binding flagellar brake protein YcgR